MNLYVTLSIAAALVALLVAGFGVFAAYLAFAGKREAFRAALVRWTVFDYLILGVFLFGTLFLLADLVGVLRDRDAYPYYHYGYVLSGFVYNTIAGIFLFARLGLALRAAEARPEPAAVSDGAPAAGDDHREPRQA
ncbi:hypothetical protein [Paenibacillus sp.]|uniref:hypothetical protein n=1 Tax=Paenibacillus sp. TaxID=58172 RepID=UPI002D6BD84C|nr:hypothetical protein [Paenibacillus sp.]HZG55552.1 hypothetical protein [Paenibacillus sp.]